MTTKKIIVLHSNTSKIVEDEILRMTNNQVDIVRIDSLSQNTEIGRVDGFNFIHRHLLSLNLMRQATRQINQDRI